MRRVAVLLIRVYQVVISPLFPGTCRYQPTCSAYAVAAISRYGVAKGGWMTIRRLLRCHPWHAGGYDPVK